jgi:hypothetical protein
MHYRAPRRTTQTRKSHARLPHGNGWAKVRISSAGIKTFVRGGEQERVTLGRYPEMTRDQARRKAAEVNAVISKGESPATEKRRTRLTAKTLGAILDEYIDARGNLKESTVFDMRKTFKEVCPDWLALPIAKLTPDLIEQRRRAHAARSKARANLAMRYIRALINNQFRYGQAP